MTAVALTGVQSMREAALRDIIHTRASSRWPWRDPVTLDPDVLAEDVRRVREYYAAQGYRHATVSSHVEPSGPGQVTVRLAVVEGEPVRLAGLRVEGFEGFASPEALAGVAGRAPLQPGDPLARAALVATAQLALDLVRDAGYPRARVAAIEEAIAPGRVQVTLRLDPGLIGVFGRVDIAGHRRVDDQVIRRYVAIRPGDRFSLGPIRATHRRLTALGLFEQVDIELVDPEARTADVATLVQVRERSQRAYQLSFGYGSEEQVSADAEWRHLNFLGGARRLSLLGRWSWLDRGVEGQLVQPYVSHPDVSLAVGGQAWTLDQRFFDVFSAGGGLGLTWRPRGRTAVSVTHALRYQRTRIDDAPASLELEELTGRQDGLLAALQLEVTRDTRDDRGDPRRGVFATVRFEQAGGWLPGVFDFRTAILDARHFTPAGPVALAHRVQYGVASPAAGAADVPLFRRFFLGGADSLRGWGRLEVAPLSAAGRPIGGRTFLAATSELRIPVGLGVGAAAFLDAGNAWPHARAARLDDLRYSAGAGLRWASPFGPARLDAGYQLNPIPGLRLDHRSRPRRWRLHVSFGAGF